MQFKLISKTNLTLQINTNNSDEYWFMAKSVYSRFFPISMQSKAFMKIKSYCIQAVLFTNVGNYFPTLVKIGDDCEIYNS